MIYFPCFYVHQIAYTSIWNSIVKFCKSLHNYWHRVTDITSFEQYWHFVQVRWNIVSRVCFWRNLSSGLLRWSSRQTNEGPMRSEFRLVGLKKVKRLRRRKYDQWSPRGLKVLCLTRLQSCTDLSESSAHWLTIDGTIWRDLFKPPRSSFPLINGHVSVSPFT